MEKTKEWDYTQQAKYYEKRPNYAKGAIAKLLNAVNAKKDREYVIADIGAGTGNLTVMLAEFANKIIAIEPNDAMRQIGIERTKKSPHTVWKAGTGEDTGLPANSVDWVTFGSSFNTTDRLQALKESHRILKKGGFFTCMWNNRDLEDAFQKKVEDIIKSVIPSYSHGTRRESQADFIISSGLFNDVHYIEEGQIVETSVQDYIDAWKSVKNQFWDLETEQGMALFNMIVEKIKDAYRNVSILKIKYITRIWTAKRVD